MSLWLTPPMGLSEWLVGAKECAANAARSWQDGLYKQYLPESHWMALIVILAVLLLPLILNIWGWMLWILLSIFLGLSRTVYSIFTVLHVLMDVWALSVMKTCYTIYRFLAAFLLPPAAASTRQRLLTARNVTQYQTLAEQVDAEDGMLSWRADDSDLPQSVTIKSTIAKLEESLQAKDTSKLQFILLNGLLKRNHLGIDERDLHIRALSGSKLLVERYDKKVVECIKYITECQELTREEKVMFVKKARRALGQTALMLSGGGSISMYHAGPGPFTNTVADLQMVCRGDAPNVTLLALHESVVRALITEGLYRHIRVISGASGGSIIAGMAAIHNEKELMDRVLVKEVSTDFKHNGEMRQKKIVWFPPLFEQAKHFIKNGILIDNKEFQRTCEFYYGSFTFQEAFERTHKHVCISVAASTLGASSQGGPRRLLLNHITTPNVLIRSAVAASCALPGIMAPNYLQCKDDRGHVVPFDMDGVQYVDGSLQADLPFRRISTLFAVSHFIVSQVNFHVVPFLRKMHSPAESSLYWKLFRFFDTDIRHRVTSLAELGLLPRVFGQDLSGIFRQRYSGHVTLTPRFRMSEMIGLKAFQNPTEAEMRHYILNGKRSVWPHLHHIKHNTLVERVLSDSLSKLRRQSYYLALGQPHADNSPASLSLQCAVPSGGGSNVTGVNPLSGMATCGTCSPRVDTNFASMLPPLPPTSNAISRCSTPRRYRDEGILSTPLLVTAGATLRRSDSGRFEDDDSDMLEPSGTPSSSACAATDTPANGGGTGSTENQRFVRSPGRQHFRIQQLQAENRALRERVRLLQQSMEALKKAESGLYDHENLATRQESIKAGNHSNRSSLQSGLSYSVASSGSYSDQRDCETPKAALHISDTVGFEETGPEGPPVVVKSIPLVE